MYSKLTLWTKCWHLTDFISARLWALCYTCNSFVRTVGNNSEHSRRKRNAVCKFLLIKRRFSVSCNRDRRPLVKVYECRIEFDMEQDLSTSFLKAWKILYWNTQFVNPLKVMAEKFRFLYNLHSSFKSQKWSFLKAHDTHLQWLYSAVNANF